MKKVLIAVGAMVVVIIGALVALPALIPASRIQAEVVNGVKAATGRDLSIRGKVAISVFPSLSVQVGDVALANPPGYTSKDLVRLGSLDVRLKLLPLLGGKVEVDSFVLVDPLITLETDRQGKGNWVFDTPAATPTPANKGQTPAAAPSSGASPSGLSDIRLGDVRISNGRLVQIDGKTGARQEVSAINLQVGLKSLSEPLSAKGNLVWNGKKIELTLGIGSLKALMDGKSSALDMAIASDPLKFGLKGNATGGASPGMDGRLDLTVPSVRDLAAWAGAPIAMAGNGLGPLSIGGNLAATPTRIAFTQAAIALDDIKAKGDVTVLTGGAKPAIKGRLDVETLDVNPYLPPEGGAAKGESKAAAGGGTQGHGKAQPQGWSDDPIDASGLKAVDLDFDLSCAGIVVRKIKVGKSALKLVIKDGKLTADLTELALYQGAGTGRVALDGSQPGVGLAATFRLKGLQAEPFLRDAADTDRLSGTGNFDVTVDGRGRTQRQIISSLGGKGALTFLNGAIKGINLAAMVRNAASAFTGGGASEKTDFAELGGTFTIAKGILSNRDLALKSPLLRVEGKGTVDLPQRSVNYRIDPKVVASLEGQGGGNAAGIVVPVLVTGPWDNLSYRPDLEALVKQNVQNVGKAVESLVPGVGGKASGGSGLNPLNLFGR